MTVASRPTPWLSARNSLARDGQSPDSYTPRAGSPLTGRPADTASTSAYEMAVPMLASGAPAVASSSTTGGAAHRASPRRAEGTSRPSRRADQRRTASTSTPTTASSTCHFHRAGVRERPTPAWTASRTPATSNRLRDLEPPAGGDDGDQQREGRTQDDDVAERVAEVGHDGGRLRRDDRHGAQQRRRRHTRCAPGRTGPAVPAPPDGARHGSTNQAKARTAGGSRSPHQPTTDGRS